MKLLGLAVGAFAALVAVAALAQREPGLVLLAVVAALNAAATFRSASISSFLKIFSAIFGVETIVFGLIVLAGKMGAWPEALKEYLPPESLPVTVAIFGVIVFLVSHIGVVRQITRIADRYFENGEMGEAMVWPVVRFRALERRIAVAMVVALVLINQGQVGISLRLSFFSRDWFNAIQNKNEAEFWQLLLWVFTPWAFIYVAVAIIEFVMQSMLVIRWRRWLTERYTAHWLDDATHYRMTLAGQGADNPDQRIAEDVNQFIAGASGGVYSYSILLISTLSTLVSFSILLWGLSTNFTIPGTNFVLPGFLFWVALIYAAVGTLITHWIGRALVPLSFQRQRYEADFRFSLARLREYAEQVALLEGEAAERRSLMQRFAAIYANYLQVVDRKKKLMAFTASYGQLSPIIPYIFTAPFYFAGKIQLGVMTQTAGAFARVEGALTFFINYYTTLAEFKAVLDRLTTFDAAIEGARGQGEAQSAERLASDSVSLDAVTLGLPDGRQIARIDQLTLAPDQSVLLTGPSGSGKSTIFRAIAGIWPHARGRIGAPADMMLLPQRPYLPIGPLREAVAYPGGAEAHADADIRAALEAAQLPGLAARLEESDNWQQRLSGGEQQRLALARALLARPKWLFLDEATSALDEKTEAAVYRMLKEKLPETTLVSIGHRSTLVDLHDRRIDLEPNADGTFSPREAAKAA